MKIFKLLLVEGKGERALYSVLLERDLLVFPINEVLGHEVFNCRQIKNDPKIQYLIKAINEEDKVEVIRIGDKLNEKFHKVPREIERKVISGTNDYHIKPELEMLLICYLNLYEKYKKGKQEPKEFAKGNITFSGKKYEPTEEWWNTWMMSITNKQIHDMFKEYERIHGKSHKKEERSQILLIKGEDKIGRK